MRQVVPLVLAGLLLSGCIQRGQPVVAERSPVFPPDVVVTEPPPRHKTARAPSPKPAPPQQRPMPLGNVPGTAPATRNYLVRRGDTLYSIAWRFGLHYPGLAAANGLVEPYNIYPGQRLLLKTAPVRTRSTSRPPSVAARRAPSRTVRPAPAKPPAPVVRHPDRWVWPVQGKPVREFGRTSKGMDFALPVTASTTPVRAAGHGEVVYAGNGIGGFEHLVIVRHSESLLSAYSFSGTQVVREQQRVKAGDKLADIKNNGRTSQKLHFELRRNGKPINPRTLLQ